MTGEGDRYFGEVILEIREGSESGKRGGACLRERC